MNTKKITIRSKGLAVELFCEPEEIEIEGNALASGDDAEDRNAENWIHDQLASGNEWAWCTAHVRVTYTDPATGDDLTSDQYLGGCSYLSRADFIGSKFTITGPRGGKRESRGYYDDMIDEGIADIRAQLARRDHFATCEHCKAVTKAARAGAFPAPCSV
jgi:hypothetical protein